MSYVGVASLWPLKKQDWDSRRMFSGMLPEWLRDKAIGSQIPFYMIFIRKKFFCLMK